MVQLAVLLASNILVFFFVLTSYISFLYDSASCNIGDVACIHMWVYVLANDSYTGPHLHSPLKTSPEILC